MAKPLDGIALHAYFRRLGFPRETQELLTRIRLQVLLLHAQGIYPSHQKLRPLLPAGLIPFLSNRVE